MGLLPWTPKEIGPSGQTRCDVHLQFTKTLSTLPRLHRYGMAEPSSTSVMYNSVALRHSSNRSRVRDRLLNTVELRSFRDGPQTE